MNMENQNAAAEGVGIFGLLGVLFVGFKLAHIIDWPWFWVLAPFWGPFGLWLMAITMLLFVFFARELVRMVRK